MEKTSAKKLIFAYVKYSRKIIFLMIVIVALFAAAFFLYSVPVEIVLYASLMCVAVIAPFVAYDFYRFCKTHKQLQKLEKSIILRADNMPQAENLLIEDYQKLIETGFADKMKVAAKSDEMRRDLIDYYTMWVHQIKTPIAAMDLLLQNSQTEENAKVLSEIGTELFKIEQYVEMVLNYLKIGNDAQTDFAFKEYNLDLIVRDAVHKYAKLFIRKRIALDYKELDCQVLTDKKWLLFVIEQILSNSIKYTQSGKISIYMDGKSSKSLVIEDTGMGISEEDLPRIFDNGFTGYNGRKDSKATGMGLYLCKSILTKMSHKIKIESVVGKGTRVIIDLNTTKLLAD